MTTKHYSKKCVRSVPHVSKSKLLRSGANLFMAAGAVIGIAGFARCVQADVTGTWGGYGQPYGGDGNPGGDASETSTAAVAIGGQGGWGAEGYFDEFGEDPPTTGGNGGRGGTGTATGVGYASDASALTISANAYGGLGGRPGQYYGHGGNGGTGIAQASGTSNFGGVVTVIANQYGGDGGKNASPSWGWAESGGDGCQSILVDKVSGRSLYGSVSLTGRVFGGDGGQGSDFPIFGLDYCTPEFGVGGAAGNATSTIHEFSTNNETGFSGATEAYGGIGGSVFGSGSGRAGGNAVASTTTEGTGTTDISATALAGGGTGGFNVGSQLNTSSPPTYVGLAGAGGDATANSYASAASGDATATSTAIGGDGGNNAHAAGAIGGDATAEANAVTVSGTALATAIANGGDGGMGTLLGSSTQAFNGASHVYATAKAGAITVYRADHSYSGGGTLSGASISVTAYATSSLSSGSLNGSTIAIAADGAGSFSMSGGTLTADETFTNSSGGTFNLSGGTANASPFVNAGTTNYSGGTIAGNIVNSGAFNIIGANLNVGTTGYTFTNASTGTIRKMTNSGTSNVYPPATFNGGTVDVQTGTMVFAGTFTVSAASTLTKAGSGTMSITGNQANGSNGTLSVTDGTLLLATNAGAVGSHSLNLAASGSGARLKLDRTQNLKSLSLDSGATAAMTSGRDKIVHTDSLSIGSTSFLDIADNGVAINYSGSSPLSTIASLVASGYASGSWNGNGINSSLANTGTFAIGYGEASTLGRSSFFGQSVDSTTVLVKYTYYGDANLDGSVDLVDLDVWLNNGGLTNAKWYQGDFNYDTVVDLIDLNLWLNNGGLNSLGDGTALGAVVPEPALGAILFPFIGMRFPRKRR